MAKLVRLRRWLLWSAGLPCLLFKGLSEAFFKGSWGKEPASAANDIIVCRALRLPRAAMRKNIRRIRRNYRNYETPDIPEVLKIVDAAEPEILKIVEANVLWMFYSYDRP